MKNLTDVLLEATNWWGPFVKKFQEFAEDILIGENIDFDDRKDLIVTKIGSPKAPNFRIAYTNKAGRKCSYDFTLPTPYQGRMINGLPIPSFVKGFKNLPKLNFDAMGNVK